MALNKEAARQLAAAREAVADGRWKPQQTDDDPSTAIAQLERLNADPDAPIHEVKHWLERLAECAQDALVFGTYPR